MSDQSVPCPDSSFYKSDCKGCPDCFKLYDELVKKYPELAMDEDAPWPNPAHAPSTMKAFMLHTDTSSAASDQGAVAFTSSPETNTTPVTSGSSTSHRQRYKCAICNRRYDRDQRARDCANKDLGLTPTKVYSNEVLFLEHLASREERSAQCQKCGRSVLRKNMARHRQQACH
ncbi:hypothetical protein M408DRAFT_31119 [Serendipita vermifera MAFF 305830]|uniref:Uncharacterized protein n=1 Tax=Serendipita vermifera MAFF 305830 TaxID=933852 RepID=A0A0C2WPG4_SERVB|nr:hypothetical protein M408DRAFT_31119 [Serendipita vermifera MAFF 305830]